MCFRMIKLVILHNICLHSRIKYHTFFFLICFLYILDAIFRSIYLSIHLFSSLCISFSFIVSPFLPVSVHVDLYNYVYLCVCVFRVVNCVRTPIHVHCSVLQKKIERLPNKNRIHVFFALMFHTIHSLFCSA